MVNDNDDTKQQPNVHQESSEIDHSSHEEQSASFHSIDDNNSNENNDKNFYSNERLLMVAFVSFITFSITQLVFAFIAESQAMIGDSVAMIVDSITYLINYCAERTKNRYNTESETLMNASAEVQMIRKRNQRKLTLQLEILPPFVSVTTLVIVTVMITRRATLLLIAEASNDQSQQTQQQPNVDIMLAFSVTNLFLDFLNVFCFAKAKHLLGYETIDRDADNEDKMNNLQKEKRHHDHTNLNMCSAYTHVFADTLRSLAVIVASLLAIIDNRVRKNVADSSAAIVVSAIIFVTLIPLFQGLIRSTKELRAIQYQEKQEHRNNLQNNNNLSETEMT